MGSKTQSLYLIHKSCSMAKASVDRLVERIDEEIIAPAEKRFDELVLRLAEAMKVRRV
jgi:hypothetical protein